MKILVFTTDIIPLKGMPTSGTALRTYGLIQGLRAHGHEVLVSVPTNAVEGLEQRLDISSLDEETRREFAALKELSFDASNQGSILAQTAPEAIVCGHWPAMTLPTKPSQVVIIDLAGPHMLERHYQEAPNQHGATLAKLSVLSNADYFIVSGAKQRLYFLSYLLRAGVESPEKRIIEIPMPMNPALPERTASSSQTYPNFVFGGVFLPWQNPAPALRKVQAELSARNKGRLTLIGGKHPNYPIKEGVYEALFQELSANPAVTTKPMLPYDEFVSVLSSMDVAVDLMQWNLERELAVTIRSTSYLWAGVPIIYNNFADISRLISRYNAGWCIDPADEAALKQVLEEIYSSPEIVRQKSVNAQRLAREVFSWDRAVRPLLEFLKKPESKRLREIDIIMDFPDNADYALTSNHSVEQYFLCRISGLNRIEFRIATHNRVVSEPLDLELYEVDSGNTDLNKRKRRLIAREELLPRDLRNNEWHAMDVSPLADSAGKTYALKLSGRSDDVTQCAGPWVVKGSPYPLLGLYFNAEQVKHTSLCIRTVCAGNQAA